MRPLVAVSCLLSVGLFSRCILFNVLFSCCSFVLKNTCCQCLLGAGHSAGPGSMRNSEEPTFAVLSILRVGSDRLSVSPPQLSPVRSSTLMDSFLEQEPWTLRSRSGT